MSLSGACTSLAFLSFPCRELRNALDTLRSETENQASAHAALCQSMRKEIETPTNEFLAKQAHHKKTAYANIEKAFKIKQQQESIVGKVCLI